jgi:hypothetical protein
MEIDFEKIDWDALDFKHDLNRLPERAAAICYKYPAISYEKYRELLYNFGVFKRRPDLIPATFFPFKAHITYR